MVKCHVLRGAVFAAMVLLLVQDASAPGWAAHARSSTTASQGDEVDQKLRQVQQGLDLTQVSRDALWTALSGESVGGTDYLTIAGDVVTGVQIAKKVRDGKYTEALKKTGKWGTKAGLSALGLSGVTAVWTTAELAADGALYLVGKFDERIVDGIVAAYIVRRSRGESDADAWSDTRDYPPNPIHGWPAANGPFATDEDYRRAQRDLDDRIHEQSRAAWVISESYVASEGDRTRFRIIVLDLVAKYDVQSGAFARTVAVPARPLWTDSGIVLSAGEVVTLDGAAGKWVTGYRIRRFGPSGMSVTDRNYIADEWIANGSHGELIGCILAPGDNPNGFPRRIKQNDARFFAIGARRVTIRGKSGKLWLGINDGWAGNSYNDNSGEVRVRVRKGPE